jgi:hypothetical protein
MIRKSAQRFSEKIMLKICRAYAGLRWRLPSAASIVSGFSIRAISMSMRSPPRERCCSTASISPGRSPPEIVRHGIGRAFQVASIFKSLTVQETMLAAVSADQRSSAVLHKRFPLPETRDRAEANDAIRRRYLAL